MRTIRTAKFSKGDLVEVCKSPYYNVPNGTKGRIIGIKPSAHPSAPQFAHLPCIPLYVVFNDTNYRHFLEYELKGID